VQQFYLFNFVPSSSPVDTQLLGGEKRDEGVEGEKE
jgi:hypothetical protein